MFPFNDLLLTTAPFLFGGFHSQCERSLDKDIASYVGEAGWLWSDAYELTRVPSLYKPQSRLPFELV